jgi:mycoredoxin
MPTSLPTPPVLTVYGARWCGDCRRTRRYLDWVGVPYEYVDLDLDDAAQARLDAAGYRAIPVVVTTAGTILVEPSDDELGVELGIAGA